MSPSDSRNALTRLIEVDSMNLGLGQGLRGLAVEGKAFSFGLYPILASHLRVEALLPWAQLQVLSNIDCEGHFHLYKAVNLYCSF
jgi:hypothetical protein